MGGKCLATYRFARDKQEMIDMAKDNLKKVACRMKKYVDKGKRPLEFEVGGLEN